MKYQRLSAFLAGRICERFMNGRSFSMLDADFKLRAGTAEAVYRRWSRRIQKRRRR